MRMRICFPKHKLLMAARTWLTLAILILLIVLVVPHLHRKPCPNVLKPPYAAIFYQGLRNLSNSPLHSGGLTPDHTKQDGWHVQGPVGKGTRLAIIRCTRRVTNLCYVLKMLGYNVQSKLSEKTVDVIWSVNQMFAHKPNLTKLVSYMQGCKPLHNKEMLLSGSNISVIPPAFKLPAQWEQFKKHMNSKGPGVLWIRKNPAHRGVKIVSDKELLNETVKRPYLVQEFMSKPFLISNRKFDMGIFAMVTSISPLRMYLYTEDFQVKFCVADYLPFDPNIKEKYVEEEVLKKVWEIPALKNLSGTPGSRRDKDVLYEYLHSKGYSSRKVHEKMLSAASEVGSMKERAMAQWDSNAPINSNRFEFLRFDMALQEDLSLMVIEINLSPVTYTSTGSPHKDMFLKLLTSTALMAGLVNTSWTAEQISYRTEAKTVSDEEINVDHEGCKTCSANSCKAKLECKTCSHCLTPRDRMQFRMAVLEHRRKKDWTRVVPPPFKSRQHAAGWKPLSDPLYLAMTETTQNLFLWYHEKCLTDSAWCS